MLFVLACYQKNKDEVRKFRNVVCDLTLKDAVYAYKKIVELFSGHVDHYSGIEGLMIDENLITLMALIHLLFKR